MNHQPAVAGRRTSVETLVISHREDGFRIYSLSDPHTSYTVSGSYAEPRCTCPEFARSNGSGNYCQHVLAVREQLQASYGSPHDPDSFESAERRAIQAESANEQPPMTPPTKIAEMLLKRSVSPDGRIDSLSVEFSMPVEKIPASEIQAKAQAIIDLQSAIVERFLKRPANGNGRSVSAPNGAKAPNGNGRSASANTGASVTSNGPKGQNGNGAAVRNDAPRNNGKERKPLFPAPESAVPARMVEVGGYEGKWGRRLFITMEVDGEGLKFFGTKKQLADAIATAGYEPPAQITEGMELNVPCAVTTKQSDDGRYTNIAEVFAAEGGRS